MSMLAAIEQVYSEGAALSLHLANGGQLSFQVQFENQLRKALLLSAASRFETEIKEIVLSFAVECATGNAQLVALVKAKAIERQYHTYFKWDSRNANAFFSLFGSEFKDYASKNVQGNARLEGSIRAFLELGDMRNQLVHLDFATFPLEKTTAEIFALYTEASYFVQRLPDLLRQRPNTDRDGHVATTS